MTLIRRVPFLLATAYVTLIGFLSSGSAHTIRNVGIHVHDGQSIQSAIDTANPYAQITVERGTYAEQLTISKDGITLIGHNAKLVPPLSPKTNTCSGLAGPNPDTNLDTQAGICITGTNVVLNSSFDGEHHKLISVGRRVKDVSVTGFSISGFDGLNIAIVAAKDTSACDNTLTDGTRYGALTVGSENSVIERNKVVSNAPIAPKTLLRFIGICMDDVSTVTVAYNHINGYSIGLCVQTDGADIHDNHVKNCCVGAYVDPAINGAKLQDNKIRDANPLCREASSGAFGVWGIAIAGSTNTLVKGNRISGISEGLNSTLPLPAAGVAVGDDFPPPYGTGDVASGNQVVDNIIVHNDIDLEITATGPGNVAKNNVCKTSSPDGLCK